MISVFVNGERQACSANILLLELLAQLNLNPQLIAVEYNGEILHRQFWPTAHLADGDRLEIVTIVGGG